MTHKNQRKGTYHTWNDHECLFNGSFHEIPKPIDFGIEDDFVIIEWKNFYCVIDPYIYIYLSDYRENEYQSVDKYFTNYQEGVNFLVSTLKV